MDMCSDGNQATFPPDEAPEVELGHGPFSKTPPCDQSENNQAT